MTNREQEVKDRLHELQGHVDRATEWASETEMKMVLDTSILGVLGMVAIELAASNDAAAATEAQFLPAEKSER